MTVIATEGGTFDRTAPPIYFSAGGPGPYPRHVLTAVNDHMTASGERHLEEMLDEGHAVFLDSGVFNLTNAHKRAVGCSMDEALALAPEQITGFDDLYARYVYLAKKFGPRLWGYIELDQGGAANKRRTRDRLHAEGLNPIPVYHPLNDGWDYFDELAEGYDRICYGNIVQANQAMRVRLVHTLWERHRQYPDLWVHILGMTVNEWLIGMAPNSCDSSTWINSLRYPRLDTEMVSLRSLIHLDPGWRYDPERPDVQYVGAKTCSAVYADTMETVNTIWHDLLDTHAEMGAIRYPPRLTEEGALEPCE